MVALEVHNLVAAGLVEAVVTGAVEERTHCTAEEAVGGLPVQLQNRGLLESIQMRCRRSCVLVDLLVNHKRKWQALVGWNRCFGVGCLLAVAEFGTDSAAENSFEVVQALSLTECVELDLLEGIAGDRELQAVVVVAAAEQRRRMVLAQYAAAEEDNLVARRAVVDIVGLSNIKASPYKISVALHTLLRIRAIKSLWI
jgi:hypothetical protein